MSNESANESTPSAPWAGSNDETAQTEVISDEQTTETVQSSDEPGDAHHGGQPSLESAEESRKSILHRTFLTIEFAVVTAGIVFSFLFLMFPGALTRYHVALYFILVGVVALYFVALVFNDIRQRRKKGDTELPDVSLLFVALLFALVLAPSLILQTSGMLFGLFVTVAMWIVSLGVWLGYVILIAVAVIGLYQWWKHRERIKNWSHASDRKRASLTIVGIALVLFIIAWLLMRVVFAILLQPGVIGVLLAIAFIIAAVSFYWNMLKSEDFNRTSATCAIMAALAWWVLIDASYLMS